MLDPTCGSGAFLFAALNILEDLYEACLDRMQAFVEELDRSGERHHPEKFGDFRRVLERIAAHPSRKYFIFKSIIVNNLYGVDIMEEAVEICKLRLFLKLVAQVERAEDIEPLPDVDFNIRAGNTLVGYATYDEVKRAVGGKLDFEGAMDRIEEKAQDVDRLFALFRRQQTELGGEVTPADKQRLRDMLKELEDELNAHLADQYEDGLSRKPEAYARWLKSHKPFHWFIEFHAVVGGGGFDVIIGNPPYLELREVDYLPAEFESGGTGAVHAMCVERSIRMSGRAGCLSMIVPLALVSTQRMDVVQRLLEAHGRTWYANFSWRPGKLFDTVNRALTIFVVVASEGPQAFSTSYQKWNSDSRGVLFPAMAFVPVANDRAEFWVPKLGKRLERSVLEKIAAITTNVARFCARSEHRIYYRTTGGLYWKVFTDFAPSFRVNGREGHSTRETHFTVLSSHHVRPVIAALSSGVFWWYYTVTSNCRDLNPYDIQHFPVPEGSLSDPALGELGTRYLADIVRNSTMLVRRQRQTGTTQTQSFKIQKSKPIIDEIDCVLAKHYGFTDEELDFIINYDIKYRMGRDAGEEER